jgi:hypothetical protein
MNDERQPVKAWSKPLLTWPEVFLVPLIIGAQLVVFLVLCVIPPTSFYNPPTPAQAIWLLVLNGLVGVPVFLKSCLTWVAVHKYSRWTVACDETAITITTHKGEIRRIPWAKFKGYVISRRPKRLINILSDDGSLDFSVPFRGFHDIHETTNRLLLTMDPRIPVGGVREGRDEPPLRVPKWLAWLLVIASVPLFGMPIWVLWLNGFAAVPGLLFELFSRLGGLIWPCVLIPPVICYVGLASLLEAKRQSTHDTVLPVGVVGPAHYFPSNKNSSRAFQIVIGGFMLFVAFTIATMRQNPDSYAMGVVMLVAVVGMLIASQRELNVSNRRVLVTSTHVVVRQGKKEWCWPNETFEVKLERGKGKFLDKVRRIRIRREQIELTLLEKWSDSDWLSRSLERASKQIGQV